MSVRRLNIGNRRTQLHSLIDMAFILLIFFLITSMMAKIGGQEQKLSIPTPENRTGRAQIVIQLISAHEFWFLDESARSIAENLFRQYPFLPQQQQIQMIMDRMAAARCDQSGLAIKITKLKEEADRNQTGDYFVLIRCPDELPYYHVMDIIQALSGPINIQYGCVGGRLEDIKNAKKVYIAEEKLQGGVRKNLVIEF